MMKDQLVPDKAGKVAEKTVAGMLYVTHAYMLNSLYQQTT